MAQPAELGNNDRGFVFALLAAASAGLLLFLPITILGYTAHVLASLINGDPLAWQSSVAMTYTFVGIPTLISVLLLFVPYRLFRAAGRRMGARQAGLVVGGLLAVWHAAVAVYWAWGSTEGFTHAPTGDVLWYPFAFGIAAVIATLLVARWAVAAPIALVVVLGLLLSGIVRGHTVVPPGAQQVEVEVTGTEVRLTLTTLNAGDVYVVLVTPRSSITLTEDELIGTDVPSHHDFDLTGCADAQRAEDRGQMGYCGNVFKVTLSPGKYVFYSTAADGPGQALARLEVLP
jgi:hypothetical protein